MVYYYLNKFGIFLNIIKIHNYTVLRNPLNNHRDSSKIHIKGNFILFKCNYLNKFLTYLLQ